MDNKELIKSILKKWGKVQGNLASDACCEMIASNIVCELEDKHDQDLGLDAYKKNGKNRKQQTVRNDCHL